MSADHLLPDAAREDSLRLLGDTLAGGAAGANSPEAVALLGTVSSWGNAQDARLLNGSGHVAAPSAAFFNGFAIHCLEWDAVHEGAVVHAMSVVTAALLASSDRLGGTNTEEFLTALAIGVDIASGLGIAATGPMKFFRPATAGVIGATLAVGRLEKLPIPQMANAMGLAYSFGGGTMQAHVEASIALPLQIANAARSAVTAVDLAKAGMNGPRDILDGPFGYNNLFEELDLDRYLGGLGKTWRINEVSIKPFPSGRASHGALGALADLREENGLSLEQVHSIELFAPQLIHRLVGRPYQEEMTPAYARLCLALLAPMMLRDGAIDPRLFDKRGLAAPELTALAQKVQVKLDNNQDANAMAPQRLIVHLTNGPSIERPIRANLGSPDAPMNAKQSAQKYELCRSLADAQTDSRVFDDPLNYVSNPE